MRGNESKAKSARRALRNISNNNNGGGGEGGRFSKSMNLNKKSISGKQIEVGSGGREGEGEYLDRLLLVQSDLSSFARQIDELVAQAFKMKSTSKQGRKEIESFAHVLSDMLLSLKPWVPRIQKVLSSPAESENLLKCSSADKTVSSVNPDENFEVENPEQTAMNSLISPSPLVSWRAGCNVDRGRQLFLLTPLPISKTLSSKHQDFSKSLFERIASNPVVELPSFLSVSGDVNDDLLEGIVIESTPNKPSDSVVTEARNTTFYECVSPSIFCKSDHQSMLVMTPCLNMSPPKSCVLLEPISESSHRVKPVVRKSTPFPVGIHSQLSESCSDSEGSDDLALKYPELLGIQRAYKSRMGKKELEASPNWCFSPPKTCVLLEAPDEKSLDTVAPDNHLPITAPVLNQQTNLSLSKEYDQELIGGSLTLVESTPMWKAPESTMGRGKRPGENTLKKELWTKFEAASTYGIRLNVSALQKTAQKGFLDMLDEVSRDRECPVADSLR